MRRTLSTVAMLLLGGVLAPAAFAGTSGTSTVTLAANATATIDILTSGITVSPTSSDYDNNYHEAAGASGIDVRVKSNSSTGMVLKVKCADASPQIALADLLIKTATAAGTGGASMSSYTAVTATDQNLWSTGVSQSSFKTVTTDVKIQNLFSYTDASGGGTTSYTNTLTYSVIVL